MLAEALEIEGLAVDEEFVPLHPHGADAEGHLIQILTLERDLGPVKVGRAGIPALGVEDGDTPLGPRGRAHRLALVVQDGHPDLALARRLHGVVHDAVLAITPGTW